MRAFSSRSAKSPGLLCWCRSTGANPRAAGRRHRHGGQCHIPTRGGPRGYFLLMDGVIRRYGIPLALWRSTASPHIPQPVGPTQFTRAMGELGIGSLPVRHRPRDAWNAGTFQDRLVSELRLAGAATIDHGPRSRLPALKAVIYQLRTLSCFQPQLVSLHGRTMTPTELHAD